MTNEDPFNDTKPDPADDFFSGGAPSCKFDAIGTMYSGTIVAKEMTQQRDLSTGEPAFWPDGNPKQMIVITLQTTERDPQIDDDDGQRRLYVKKPSGMFAAIKTALGKNKLVPGGMLKIKYVKNGKKTNPAHNAPKEYIAQYVPTGNGSAATAPEQAYPKTRETVASAAPSNPFEGGPPEFTEGDIPF